MAGLLVPVIFSLGPAQVVRDGLVRIDWRGFGREAANLAGVQQVLVSAGKNQLAVSQLVFDHFHVLAEVAAQEDKLLVPLVLELVQKLA